MLLSNTSQEEIETYLSDYWLKYPSEKPHDPTIENIINWIKNGGLFHLNETIFILYSLNKKIANIYFYWCDMGDVSRKQVKKTLINHKKFINSLNAPVYSKGIKDIFKRDYLVKKENNLWRWM